jgi:lipopolysaccharide transport system ATP-binding protein
MNDGIYNVQNIFVADRSVPLFVHYDAHKFEIFDDRDIPEWHGKWIGAVRPTFIKSSLLKI